MKRFLFAVLLVLSFVSAQAVNTYYVDYASGSDSNTPTQAKSKTTPWKTAPSMNGSAISGYSHAAGDQFIFKGGVTWPNGCFCWTISNSGNSTTPDYYGVDATWYTGGSWARPIFSGGGTPITHTYNMYVYFSGASYVTIDNIEFSGFYWNSATQGWPSGQMINVQSGSYVTIQNCYFHNWSHDTLANGCTNASIYCICGATSAPWSVGSVVDSCTATDDVAGDSGALTYAGIQIVRNCTISHTPNGIISAGTTGAGHLVYGNTLHDMAESFDHPTTHENGIYFMGAGSCYSNTIYSNHTPGMNFYISPSWGNNNANVYVYNNLSWDWNPSGSDANGTIMIDNESANYSGTIYVLNNTVTGNVQGGMCLGSVGRTYTISAVVSQNNHFITDGTPTNWADVPTSLTQDHNMTLGTAAATADGYTVGNHYAPTSSGNPTVDAGTIESSIFTTDILGTTRPQGSAWDIGAYEYSGGGSTTSSTSSSTTTTTTIFPSQPPSPQPHTWPAGMVQNLSGAHNHAF